MYSALVVCAPKPRRPKPSITGAPVFSDGVGGVGDAAGGILPHVQLACRSRRRSPARARRAPATSGLGSQRREAALEDELDLRLRQELLRDALAQLLLDAVVVGDARDAHVAGRLRLRRDHVADDAGARQRPVHLDAGRRVREIAHLQDLEGELVERVDARARARRRRARRGRAPSRARAHARSSRGARDRPRDCRRPRTTSPRRARRRAACGGCATPGEPISSSPLMNTVSVP